MDVCAAVLEDEALKPALSQARANQMAYAQALKPQALKRPMPQSAARPFRVNVGRRVRELREALGISQIALGRLVGVSGAHVSMIEHGRAAIPPARCELFATALGVDRRSFGLLLLRNNDPWVFRLIFGAD